MSLSSVTARPSRSRSSTANGPEHGRRLRGGREVGGAVPGPTGIVRGLAYEPRLEQRLQGERDRRLRDADPARDLRPRDRRGTAYRLEDGTLVEVLEQRRS